MANTKGYVRNEILAYCLLHDTHIQGGCNVTSVAYYCLKCMIIVLLCTISGKYVTVNILDCSMLQCCVLHPHSMFRPNSGN